MVTKLVNENIIREGIIRCDCTVEIKNAAPAVGTVVGQHFDKLVRRKRCGLAQGVIIKRQNVALRSKCVVGSAEWRVAVDAGGRSRNARLCSGRAQTPDVEILRRS